MKNGGWLDNYGEEANANDGYSSAPDNWRGDGYSNVGRNYSPAWGGQFEDGGEIPIAQGGRATSADSLAVYNDVMRTKKYYETHNTKYFQKPKISPSWWADKSHMSRVQKDHLEHTDVTAANKQKIRQNKNPNQYLLSDMITGAIDKNAPLFRYDSRIVPQGTITYAPKSYLSPVLKKLDPNFDKLSSEEKDAIYSMLGGYNNIMTPAHSKIYKKWKGKHPHDLKKLQDLYKLDRDVSDHAPGYITTLPYYDPLAVKPYNLRTPQEKIEWRKKYGPNKTKDKPNDIAPIQRPKLEAIQSLNPQVVNSDFDVTAQLPVIRPEARLPKSFDVNSQRQTMSGPSEYYDYSGEGVDISDAVRAKQSADAYNQYVQEKYKEAAKSNPKAQKRLEQLMQNVELTPNYQMGGSIPGSPGFTYARTQGIPSEGPYAKKTKASAQNGYVTGDKVEYGTPEYTEAYNKGEVVTDEGVRSPIALDEVVIQNNYKRPRGFWEQYADKIVEENKDAGLLGAIIGTPISAVASLPQLAMMKGLTGEMQRPSEAMDIENPYGAMAVDVVTDPANLIGAGILTKEKALARLSNLKNINAEGKIFSGMNNELNNMAIQNTERYMAKRTPSNAQLSKELEPYVSRIGEPSISREEEVFRNVMGHDYRVAKELENTKFLDPDGNIISNPNTTQQQFYYGDIPATDRPLNKQGFPNPVKIIDDIVPMNLQPQAIIMGNGAGGWNSLSPLNWLPGYGKKLSSKGELYGYPGESRFFNANGPVVKEGINPINSNSPAVGFRKFGNSLQDVIDRQALSPKGSGKFTMGRDQIISEGNWAATGSPDEAYKGVFEATMNPNVIGSKIKQVDMGSTRNGTLYRMTDNNVDIPLSDPGLSFNRRLPFSTRYVKVDKQKLIDDKFQLATQLPHVQSLVEKYASYAGPLGAAGYIANGTEGAKENIDLLNKYTIDPIIDYTKPYYKKAKEEFNRQTRNKKDGGVIKDDMGYWNPENWDSPVEIGSNEITMQDVPFDVLGISDTGDTKLMKPGKNYKFKGKKVTEFPMAKNGLRQEQKGLQNLDNLLNFTNYNKPQPGGWLNKYN
jgi:hypothetical protein